MPRVFSIQFIHETLTCMRWNVNSMVQTFVVKSITNGVCIVRCEWPAWMMMLLHGLDYCSVVAVLFSVYSVDM